MTKFQLVILLLFGGFVIGGIALFSLSKGRSQTTYPPVTIWGTLDARIVSPVVDKVVKESKGKRNITYIQKRPEKFDQEYLEALALGTGPDAVLLSQDLIMRHYNKLIPIPYQSYSQRDFLNTYIPESQLYLDPQGIIAVPFVIDPMVMYWNKNMFLNANLALPPKYWEEFGPLVPLLTVRDAALNITQSAVGLGEYRNIDHAKEILSLLIMQAGNPITVREGGAVHATIGNQLSSVLFPADAAMTFYTKFANPVKDTYTWNRSLPPSKSMFISNKLAMYFGYASEYADIILKNPNLSFDIALVPQIKPTTAAEGNKITFGRMYAFSISRSTKDVSNTAATLYLLSSKSSLDLVKEKTKLPSVRLDSLTPDPADPLSAIFSSSALWSRAWLDPNSVETEKAFQNLIESVTSGRANQQAAIAEAQTRIESLLRQ